MMRKNNKNNGIENFELLAQNIYYTKSECSSRKDYCLLICLIAAILILLTLCIQIM